MGWNYMVMLSSATLVTLVTDRDKFDLPRHDFHVESTLREHQIPW